MSLLKLTLLLVAAALTACMSLQDQGSSAAARQQLAPTGNVRAAISVGPAASTFRATVDPATNRPRGVAVDLAHALGRQLGAPVELVTYSNYPDLLNAAARGDWDVTFLPFDEERTKVIDYGPAYYFFEFTYLVPEGSPIRAHSDVDRPGVRVAVAEGSVTARNRERALKNATLVRFKTVTEIREQVRLKKSMRQRRDVKLSPPSLLNCLARVYWRVRFTVKVLRWAYPRIDRPHLRTSRNSSRPLRRLEWCAAH
jgi:polar amino acid transport system substrate-binding protein